MGNAYTFKDTSDYEITVEVQISKTNAMLIAFHLFLQH